TIPIALPGGRAGFQPHLNLTYSTGHGNGLFGLGWSLNVSGISRRTFKGVPRYGRQSGPAANPDTFILSGLEDLVFVEQVTDEAGITADKYRPRTEGFFAEIHHYRNIPSGIDYWRVRTIDGVVSYYGTNPTPTERPQYPPDAPDTGNRAIIANL